MSKREILIEQFDACWNDDSWFVSLKTVLDGVTAEQAAWKPEGTDNSIWETLNHIIYWTERWLKRYRRELNYPEDIDNDTTFHSDESDWEKTLEKLDSVMLEWRKEFSAMSDEELAEHVNAEYKEPFWKPLAHQNVHNAYHIGQILLLRKLQKSWDPEKGVS